MMNVIVLIKWILQFFCLCLFVNLDNWSTHIVMFISGNSSHRYIYIYI